jgi:hypothetical protein
MTEPEQRQTERHQQESCGAVGVAEGVVVEVVRLVAELRREQRRRCRQPLELDELEIGAQQKQAGRR